MYSVVLVITALQAVCAAYKQHEKQKGRCIPNLLHNATHTAFMVSTSPCSAHEGIMIGAVYGCSSSHLDSMLYSGSGSSSCFANYRLRLGLKARNRVGTT